MQKKEHPLAVLRHPVFRLAVASGTALLLIAFVILRYEGFFAAVRAVLRTLRPLLLGVLFATMLNPSYEQLRTDFAAFVKRRRGNAEAGWIRVIALIGAILPPLLILVSVICVLIPQLMASVRLLTENLSFYSGNLLGWLKQYPESALAAWLPEERLEEVLSAAQSKIPELLLKTYDYTASVLAFLLDIGIGTVFSLYLLADKSRLKKQMRVLCGRMVQADRLHALARRARLTCNTFARFLTSQCKEALILGVLCYLGMLLFHFPYPVLISVLIGITNIVPYVGPLIGTIPCLLILLLVQPRAALWFLLYVIVLQQIESNLIYPRIVGHSIGLPPTWVLTAIVIGGGLFGAMGLLLGVPLAAVAYAVLFPEQAAADRP